MGKLLKCKKWFEIQFVDTLNLQELINLGLYNEALNSLNGIENGNPDEKELMRAKIMVYQKNYNDAIIILEKLVRNRNLDVNRKYDTFTLLALSYIERDQLALAKLYIRAIELEFPNYFIDRKEENYEMDAMLYRAKAHMNRKEQEFEIADAYLELASQLQG